jgi:hypothetical protein
MTERQFGFSQNMWWGEVVNVNDPDQDGRCQVRIHGQHDDTTNIPDSMLPWAKPCQDITSAGHNKIGTIPVGAIKGTTLGGYYLDSDMQYPVFTHTIAKAGDPSSSANTTFQGSLTLEEGTNSSPIGNRNKNNAFITRKGKNIQTEDNASTNPVESNDSDGVDVTAQASQKTKFSTQPTVGSVQNPQGSILTQLASVDPTHLTSVLPNAVSAITKIKDLNAFSTTNGVTNVLGLALGKVIATIGAALVANAIANSIKPGQLSATSQQALLVALLSLGSNPTSTTVQSVIGMSYNDILLQLLLLIKTNTLNAITFNALMALHFSNIQNNGANATIGVNQSGVLNSLSSVLPTIAGAINATIKDHLPTSTLNTSTITAALQRFAMNQAFLKSPSNGKKELAIQATTGSNPASIANSLNTISGITSATVTALNNIL